MMDGPMTDLLTLYQEEKQRGFFEIHSTARKPNEVKYTLKGSEQNPDAYKDWTTLDESGLSLSFQMSGDVTSPTELTGYEVKGDIVGTIFRPPGIENGAIGFGWLHARNLHFKIYLSPDTVREKFEQLTTGPDLLDMRITLIDVQAKLPSLVAFVGGEIYYNIGQINFADARV
jgi:hypothetical protein